MRRRTSKITVTSAAGLTHGVVLAIGSGEDMELARVHWPWWRRFAAWLRATAGPWLRRRLCGAGGHRITRAAVGLNDCEAIGLRHCWCRSRWEDGADWDDDEDGCE